MDNNMQMNKQAEQIEQPLFNTEKVEKVKDFFTNTTFYDKLGYKEDEIKKKREESIKPQLEKEERKKLIKEKKLEQFEDKYVLDNFKALINDPVKRYDVVDYFRKRHGIFIDLKKFDEKKAELEKLAEERKKANKVGDEAKTNEEEILENNINEIKEIKVGGEEQQKEKSKKKDVKKKSDADNTSFHRLLSPEEEKILANLITIRDEEKYNAELIEEIKKNRKKYLEIYNECLKKDLKKLSFKAFLQQKGIEKNNQEV